MAGDTTNIATLVMAESPNHHFATRTPRSDSIKAVKLTEGNLQAVAGHVLDRVGGTVSVEDSTTILFQKIRFAGIGDWLIEGYDYGKGRATFRRANLTEREKYDLR